MKKHKILFLILALISFGSAFSLNTTEAHALANEWRTSHWVTITKKTKVAKIKIVNPMYKSYSVKRYTLKKGSHYKLDHWGVNYSWALQSGKFNTNNKYIYAVDRGWNDASWFKMGIHKMKATKKYKSFHGYRVALKKSDYTYNTFYDTKTHATLADYRPTQKSKVIFKYGSQVYPTHHEWDWFHGDYMTEYHFKNGSWHKGSTF